MKKPVILTLSFLFGISILNAEDTPRDSLRVVDVEEVTVIASLKENRKLRELPGAVTVLSQEDIQANQVTSIKNLTALAPNFFIPDYGSRLTSAIYIRGIGSRINTPAVGLYVDNVPFIDKSAFDFNYAGIERIDVLRGPQGTLYGRNAMGGLIRIYTKSPFNYQGTDVHLGMGTYGNRSGSLNFYHRLNDRFAFSAGGFYEHSSGFFKNSHKKEKADVLDAGGGRLRGIWLPSDNLKLDLNLSYEYSEQGAYPYFYTGAAKGEKEDEDLRGDIGKISFNDENSYKRGLFNSSFSLEHQGENFILSSVTGYQNLKDRMAIDQDFTKKDLFNLIQKQRIHTLSEEIVLKSKPGRAWEWATGVFGFYQALKTQAPVTFKQEGIKEVIEGKANEVFDSIPNPTMRLTVNNQALRIRDDFKTPVFNIAAYHQSTFNNVLVDGLSITAGLRIDYEKMSIRYDAESDSMNFDFDFSLVMGGPMPPMVLHDNLNAGADFKGKLKDEYLQLLPKFALQYEWKKGNNVYATVSRSHRSGGYNLQMFSELISKEIQNTSKAALMESPVFGRASGQIDKYMPSYDIDIEKEVAYKPEYSWNYEIGTRLSLWDGRLWADLAAFILDTKDQQIARFADSDLGRVVINAGHSRSRGAEASIRAQVTDGFGLNVNYGYTRAKFKDYKSRKLDDAGEPAKDEDGNAVYAFNYDGNYVPFVPRHTFSANGQYTWRFGENKAIQALTANVGYNGVGKIYWMESNDASQSYYGTMNARISVLAGCAQIDIWGRNIFDKEFTSFYFENMDRGFKQKGRPAQFGVDVRWRF